MQPSYLLSLLASSIVGLSFLNASSLINSEDSGLKIFPVPDQVEELTVKGAEEASLMKKCSECDESKDSKVTSESSSDCTSSSDGSDSPIETLTPSSSSPASISTISSSSSSKSPEPFDDFESKFIDQQNSIKYFSTEIRKKNFKAAVELLGRIQNWKMTQEGSNLSVLSEISKHARKRFLGKLRHRKIMEIFAPLLRGIHKKYAGGYISALALFHPEIQLKIMTILITYSPDLRGFLLQASIYYQMNVEVICLLLNSNAKINVECSNNPASVQGLSSYSRSKDIEFQIPVNKRFFMNFHESHSFDSCRANHITPDTEVNFLFGMLESAPKEFGAIRAAFEHYPANIVMALVQLSPFEQMAKYHLAHLLAKYPEKQEGYPPIETLVDSAMVLSRLQCGEADLVALAFLSQLEPIRQLEIMVEFLSKTNIVSRFRLMKPQTLVVDTSIEFNKKTGIYELPLNPVDVFLLTACKWNIDDVAFGKLYLASIHVSTPQFYLAVKFATTWCETNGFDRKKEILSIKPPSRR